MAEATGQPGFVVPALLAAAASQIVVGNWSFSPYQRRQRAASIAPMSSMRLGDVMTPNPDTIAAEASLAEVGPAMMAANRRWAPVIDQGRYVGMLALADVAPHPPERWSELKAGDLARPVPPASLQISVAEAARLIRSDELGALAVTDGDTVVGVLTSRDVTDVERVLDALSPETTSGH